MSQSIVNVSRNQILASEVRDCRTLFSRMKGLLGTKFLRPNEACWITPCQQIHTFGMKYAIDVYFLDKQSSVIAIHKGIKPNRMSAIHWKAHSVIEFMSGEDRNCCVGDKLSLGNL